MLIFKNQISWHVLEITNFLHNSCRQNFSLGEHSKEIEQNALTQISRSFRDLFNTFSRHSSDLVTISIFKATVKFNSFTGLHKSEFVI